MNNEEESKNAKYDEIMDIFDCMFRKHSGLLKDNTFNPSIWFLKDDREFHQAKKENVTPNQQTGNIIHDIILELSTEKNLKLFRVKVLDYCERLTNELLESEKAKRDSELQKKDYNAYVVSGNIQAKLREIEKVRITVPDPVSDSSLTIAVDNVPQFEKGKFKLKLLLTEVNSSGKENVNEQLIPIDLTNGEIQFAEAFSLKKIKFDSTNLSGIESYNVEGYHYSGVNIHSFKFLLLNNENNVLSESTEDYLLEFFLNNVESFMDLSKSHVVITYRPSFSSLHNRYREVNIKFAIMFSVDYQIRDCILKQVYKIFTTLLATNKHEKDKIRKILSYYPEYSEKIQSVLEGRSDKGNCTSCNNCILF